MELEAFINYRGKMIFCCGEIMKEKNKLTYFLNKNQLIDSLVIESLETDKKMSFEYEYQ